MYVPVLQILSVYTGQSSLDLQLSPLDWQVMDIGQSVSWLHPPEGVVPCEQVPPLVAAGQLAAVTQVMPLLVEQV